MITSRKKSEELFKKACQVLPGGVNSPVRAFVGLGVTPLIVEKGKGDTIWDIDGHAYVDFCCSWGALILGHAKDTVVKAATAQIEKGSSFGITTPVEEALASRITEHVITIEKLRFVSSGTEATMSAIRLARAYTRKSLLLKFNGNYHGHSDFLLTGAGSGVTHLLPSCPGIPKEVVQSTLSARFNDVEGVRKLLRSQPGIAAVILEPIAGNMGLVPASCEFLTMLREETKKCGALLIFDEVISGFRTGLEGAQGDYDIEPDLTCLGKIIGGGFPAAAFGGRREIMDLLAPNGQVYQAGTLSGNPVAMSAGLATLLELEKPRFYESLQEKTLRFLDPIQDLIQKKNVAIYLSTYRSMFSFFFGVSSVSSQEDVKEIDKELFSQFFSYLLERGIYLSPSPYEVNFISSAHTEENLSYVQKCICEFIENF
jgi:glutamate-1-semialdehyde 2,1-aminomutase